MFRKTESVPRHRTTQLLALDTSYPPRGTTRYGAVRRYPWSAPFEVYSQAPLRLISWCSFELPRTARKLLRELAEMCELPETTTQALVTHIAAHNSEVKIWKYTLPCIWTACATFLDVTCMVATT